MEMVLSSGFSELSFDEIMLVDGGTDDVNVWHVAGEIVGAIAGIVWDIAVVVRAVYTGSWV